MNNMQITNETNDKNALAQQYYDLVAISIQPKLEEYLNMEVSRRILKKRINECRNYYIQLSAIQYKISQIPPNEAMKYTRTKDGETEPEEHRVKAIDTQAKDWLNRLSTTITFMVIKQSEYDVKSSFRRDIIICIISILISILSGIIISWSFADKEKVFHFPQIDWPWPVIDPLEE